LTTLREALAAATPRFPLKRAWQPLVAGLRAHARETGVRSPYASRRALDRALASPVREGADVRAVKAALGALLHGAHPSTAADAAELLFEVVRPRATTAKVRFEGWPRGFDKQQRLTLLGGVPGDAVPAEQASQWVKTLHGLALGGGALRVHVELEGDAWLPPPARRHRRRTDRERRAWLPHLDDVGRFSLTPRRIADRQAAWLAAPLVIDAFCGCGGNAIAFALAGSRVFAVERDRVRLALARRNAHALGVADRIEFHCADVRPTLPELPEQAALFLDPPWGGEAWDRTGVSWDQLVGELPLGARTVMLKAPRSFDLATAPGRWEPRWEVEPGFVRLVTLKRDGG